MTWPTNTNTSATGGYLIPAAPGALPGSLTFRQFLQTIFVGISGLPGDLVRPRWQVNPPKQPDLEVNWLAIGVSNDDGGYSAYVGQDADGNNLTVRQTDLEVQCAFYGPEAGEYVGIVRDGFQVQQNLEGLRAVNMGFVRTSAAKPVPDLVNERWVNRIEMTVFLRREVQRVYPILNFVSAIGSVHAVVSGNLKTIPIKAGAPA